MKLPKLMILTLDSEGEECWTNPPNRNINEVWEFIYDIFKDKYIKAFLFDNEVKTAYIEASGQCETVNEPSDYHYNPKEKETEYEQLELW